MTRFVCVCAPIFNAPLDIWQVICRAQVVNSAETERRSQRNQRTRVSACFSGALSLSGVAHILYML
jgi:hypothetical protein